MNPALKATCTTEIDADFRSGWGAEKISKASDRFTHRGKQKEELSSREPW